MNTATELILKTGERYWRRDGLLSGTIVDRKEGKYNFRDMSTGESYLANGSNIDPSISKGVDLIRLADPSEYAKQSTENHDGDELPGVAWFSISAEEYILLKDLAKLQADKIKRLQSLIDKKNKIMNDVLEIVRHETQKDEK